MALTFNGITPTAINYNGTALTSVVFNGVTVWGNEVSGNNVTYICNGVTYTEFVATGKSCLSPTSFTPSKYDATFLGWSTSASSTIVQTNLNMGNSAITLYAVFKHDDVSFTLSNSTYNTIATKTISVTSTNYSSATLTLSGSGYGYGANGSYCTLSWYNSGAIIDTSGSTTVIVGSGTMSLIDGLNDSSAITATLKYIGKTVVG